ncbi:hypothetical protein AJ78_07082 [Emergomyces pasteurianus Ep9510]|uniref:Major facilitator superfamily (MFS) profile domain-containing protein n=1 Tax=Emergomyces pasteurianus Ep9510 TaxID=1447872 RepID=A0A1J9PWM8_9EURO|nr:hypothetical protein AJ78_07082 [Emergomyces pasteurianus Ep9510]
MGELAGNKIGPVHPSTCSSSSGGIGSKENPQRNVILSFDNDELSYDRGWKAWSQVLASFFLFFNTWGIVIAYGSFQTYYEQHLLAGESPSTIAWIGSIQSFLLLFVGAITGPLFDAGYARIMLIVGWLLYSFGLMMTSISTKLWQIMLSQALCVGLGLGAVFVPCVAIIPQYFKRRRALANGMAATGTGIGGLVYPIMFRQVQLKLGFAWATRVLGFTACVTGLISLSLLRVRFKPQEKRALVQLSAFKEPVFSLFCISQFIGFTGLYNVLVYIQPYVIEKGIMSEDLAFYLVALLNASSTIGRILPNYIADYIGPLNIIIPMSIASGVLAIGWIGIQSTAGVIVLVVLYGFTAAGFVSLAPIAFMNITPDMRDFGTRLGMSFVVCSLGSLMGTPIGGAIVHSTRSYVGVAVLVGICFLLSAGIMTAARFLLTGPKFFACA